MKKCDAGDGRSTDCHTGDVGHRFAMTGFFWGVRCVTAGGVEPRPYVWQDDFYINVIPRSEATWESVFPYDRGRCGGITDCHTSVRTGSQ